MTGLPVCPAPPAPVRAARAARSRPRAGTSAALASLAASIAVTVTLAGPVAARGAATAGAAGAARAAGATVGGRAASTAGTVVAWGDNHNGQIGDGTTVTRYQPVGVLLPSGTVVSAVATGGKFSLALTSTGTVLAWGHNLYGELGDGSTTDRLMPVAVALPKATVITAIAAGGGHSLAVTAAGHVLAWGENQYGQLGNGTTVASDVPVRVRLPRGTRVVAVRASYNWSIALTAAGKVLTWGYNGSGQLGNGFRTASEIPVRVRLPKDTNVKAIATNGFAGLALTSAGHVLAWGDNRYGQLGTGNLRSTDVPVRVKLPAGTKVVALGGGSQHTLALTSTGRVLAWGQNQYGQLGNGTKRNSDVPVAVRLPAGASVTAVSAGGGFSLALTSTGQILAWGNNAFGQLGNGGTTVAVRPVMVSLPAGLQALALAAGPTTRHNLAVVGPTGP